MLARAAGFDPFSEPPGTMHADDAFIMFGNANIPFSPIKTEADASTNKNIWRLWTDFAKTMDPTPSGKEIKWER